MGTGLTIIVGENGCGKTTILDSIAISMLDYRAESFNIYDFNEFNKEVNIVFYLNIFSYVIFINILNFHINI